MFDLEVEFAPRGEFMHLHKHERAILTLTRKTKKFVIFVGSMDDAWNLFYDIMGWIELQT